MGDDDEQRLVLRPFCYRTEKKRDSNLFSTYSIPNNLEWDESKRIQKWEGTHHVMYFEIKNKKKAIHIVLVAYIPKKKEKVRGYTDTVSRCVSVIRHSAWSSRSIERSILFYSFCLSFSLFLYIVVSTPRIINSEPYPFLSSLFELPICFGAYVPSLFRSCTAHQQIIDSARFT